MTNTGFGVSIVVEAADELDVGIVVVELEVGVGVDEDVELLGLVAAGTGTGSTTVAVTSAVTVGPGLVISTVFVVRSTIVVASAGASVDAPPSTLMTE